MTVTHERVSIGATATALNSPPGRSGARLIVRNAGPGAGMILGGAGVTEPTGYFLAEGASLEFSLAPGEQVFAIRTTTDVVAHVIRLAGAGAVPISVN